MVIGAELKQNWSKRIGVKLMRHSMALLQTSQQQCHEIATLKPV
jgi:hypothetical protein